MILPEWTTRKEAGVTPPSDRIFFVPFEEKISSEYSPK